MTVFPNLPFNTNRFYSMAITDSGCEVFIPGTTSKEASANRDAVQQYLNTQNTPPNNLPILPPIA